MKIIGTKKSDDLTGTSGDDVIKGRGGADDIWSLSGTDKLWGGKGADTFHFSISSSEGVPLGVGLDRIKDFQPGKDTVMVHVGGPTGGVEASLSYDPDAGVVLVHSDAQPPGAYAIAKIGTGLLLVDGDLVMA